MMAMISTATDNFKGAILMVASMAAFAIEDGLIKAAAGHMPAGQVLAALGLGGWAAFTLLLWRNGQRFFTAHLRDPLLLARTAAEMLGTFGYVSAFTSMSLSVATALLQAMPLAVVVGASIFLREKIGPRRWSAVGVGMIGMILIIRPGTQAFDPYSLYAILGVVGLTARDLVTRRMRKDIPSAQLSAAAFLAVIPAGAFMLFRDGERLVMVSGLELALLFAALLCGLLGYITIVTATRIAEASAITSYRFTRLVFGLLVGVLAFQERPDAITLIGAGIIVSSGAYAMMREARLKRQQIRARLNSKANGPSSIP